MKGKSSLSPATGEKVGETGITLEHHQMIAGTLASMAPGFETPEALAKSKASPDYWAKKRATPKKDAA